jgi:hypothetical protein
LSSSEEGTTIGEVVLAVSVKYCWRTAVLSVDPPETSPVLASNRELPTANDMFL